MNESIKVEDDPKSALASYIIDLDDNYYTWYETAANRNYRTWSVIQGLAILSGLATSAIAGLSTGKTLDEYSIIHSALVILPLFGTFASTLLLQTRVRDLFALRERGRQELQRIVSTARAEFAAADTPQRYTQIYRDVVSRVASIEDAQSKTFFSIVPDLANVRGKDGD